MSRSYHTERDVKAHVKTLLTQHGWMWWMPPGSGFGRSNVDFNALNDGVFLAIETKFGSNKPTALQCKYLQAVLHHRGHALVVTEKTLEAFERWCVLAPQHVLMTVPSTADNRGEWLQVLLMLTHPLSTRP